MTRYRRKGRLLLLYRWDDKKIARNLHACDSLSTAVSFFCFVVCGNAPVKKISSNEERREFRKELIAYFDKCGLDGREAGKLFSKIKRR